MAGVAYITPERMANKADFRMQLNNDKKGNAYGYNALVEYYGSARLAKLRNRLSGAMDALIAEAFTEMIQRDANFARFLVEAYLPGKVDPRLMGEAREWWQAHGLLP